jgi:hypothetical protein
VSCSGPQSDGGAQGVKVGGDALIEAIESVTPFFGESRVGRGRPE